MNIVVVGLPDCLAPILMDVTTKQERLLAFGHLMQRLPKLPPKDRKPVQEWLRGKIDPTYLQLAQRFASAKPSFVLRALVDEMSLEEINERV